MKRLLFCLLISAYLTEGFAKSFSLTSPAFEKYTAIPKQFTCNGTNSSPPLIWTNPPKKTKFFALIVNDIDAPNGTWTHWVLYNIPTNISTLPEGAFIHNGASSGQNSWGTTGYRGPCPPNGEHRYVFTLYALDKEITLYTDVNQDTVSEAMKNHIIGSAELTGLYNNNQK